MGIILSTDLISVADAGITARTADAGYPKVNVMDFWHLLRRFRANDVLQSDTDYLIKFDLTEAKTIVSVFLNHVNFDTVRIRGHATDLGNDWSTADYDSGEITISLDTAVNRYKAYIPLTAFNYRWLAIQVPVAATAVGDYTTKWQIGTICIMDSVVTLSKNIAYGYRRSAGRTAEDITLKSGGGQRVGTSSMQRWQGTIVFGVRSSADEAELWTLNNLNFADPVVFYENDNDTSKAYLCLRDNFIESSIIARNVTQGSTMRFREI